MGISPGELVSSATRPHTWAHSGQEPLDHPADAEKPTDARIKSGKYIKQKADRQKEA